MDRGDWTRLLVITGLAGLAWWYLSSRAQAREPDAPPSFPQPPVIPPPPVGGTPDPVQVILSGCRRLVVTDPPMAGADVRTVQGVLRYFGFATTEDSIYTENTASAVRSFQTSQAMSPTGIVDVATWQALQEAVASRGGYLVCLAMP